MIKHIDDLNNYALFWHTKCSSHRITEATHLVFNCLIRNQSQPGLLGHFSVFQKYYEVANKHGSM